MQTHSHANTNSTHPLRRAALPLATALLIGKLAMPAAIAAPAAGPVWTPDGKLELPDGYHSWVFLGSPLTPHALNDGGAGFPEYHNVYIHPDAYRHYRETGDFPEGTILLKELQLTAPGTFADGSRGEASGRGYFPAARNGIDISVKDSERFGDTNGWGFFNFGHHAPPYAKTATAAPKEACAGCHIANTDNMVFMQFYRPILDAE
ncbi:MAG: cytochrome P460 family protein [Gammaproteobacteria bacterium]|nr:cytochrome P460 family protein [Gammaproteobacteria bacterium]